MNPEHKWDAYIKESYLAKSDRQMEQETGKSRCYIKGRMRKLGLVVPEAVIKERMKNTRFRKGQEAFNKGKKQEEFMSPAAIERTRKTRFKKGNLPPNTKADGEISVRRDTSGIQYKYIRIALGEWELLHRQVWGNHNGKIPEGMLVVFKDGNSLNCRIENLEMISLQENMRRNSACLNLTDGYVANTLAWRNKQLKEEVLKIPQLIELKRTQLLLERTIRNESN